MEKSWVQAWLQLLPKVVAGAAIVQVAHRLYSKWTVPFCAQISQQLTIWWCEATGDVVYSGVNQYVVHGCAGASLYMLGWVSTPVKPVDAEAPVVTCGPVR